MRSEVGNADVMGSFDDGSFRLKLIDGPLDLTWKHCSIASDCLANIFSRRFDEPGTKPKHILHSVSYVVNEIIENAMKFRSTGDIAIESTVEGKQFRLCIANSITKETAIRFQGVLAKLESRDPSELLIERIEENATDPESTTSGVGLLTLMSDYGVRLGWKFLDRGSGGAIRLETHAVLPLD